MQTAIISLAVVGLVISISGYYVESKRIKRWEKRQDILDRIDKEMLKSDDILKAIETEDSQYLKKTWLEVLNKQNLKIEKLFIDYENEK